MQNDLWLNDGTNMLQEEEYSRIMMQIYARANGYIQEESFNEDSDNSSNNEKNLESV